MTRDQSIQMARKLKALAEKSEGGEKAAATSKLKSFCHKHGLDEDEYSTEIIRVSIGYKNQEEKNLLSNVMCMVMETDNVKGTDKDGNFSFQCSPREFELIKDAYAYYRSLYREYCEAVLVAMVTKNEIINLKKDTGRPFSMEEMNDEERKEWEETLKKMQPPEPPPEPPKEEPAAKSGPTATPPPPKAPTDEAKRLERISRLVFIMEPSKWEAPKPKAKLFLG